MLCIHHWGLALDLPHAKLTESLAGVGPKEALIILGGLRNVADDFLTVRVQHHALNAILHNLRVVG